MRHGNVEDVRGRKGEIRLARRAAEITIGEIGRVSETTHVETDGFGGNSIECAIRPATPINQMVDATLYAFISVLDEHTAEDMIFGWKNSGASAGSGEFPGNIP